MEAKDTVMKLDEIEIKGLAFSGNDSISEIINKVTLQICDQQAEISFKAGIREVVEWIRDNSFGLQAMDNYRDLGIDSQKWQAFKEKTKARF